MVLWSYPYYITLMFSFLCFPFLIKGKKVNNDFFSLFLTQRVNNNILIFLLIFLLFIIIIRFCVYIYIYIVIDNLNFWSSKFFEFSSSKYLININIFYQLNNNSQWIFGLMKLPLLCWKNFRDSISNIFTWQK